MLTGKIPGEVIRGSFEQFRAEQRMQPSPQLTMLTQGQLQKQEHPQHQQYPPCDYYQQDSHQQRIDDDQQQQRMENHQYQNTSYQHHTPRNQQFPEQHLLKLQLHQPQPPLNHQAYHQRQKQPRQQKQFQLPDISHSGIQPPLPHESNHPYQQQNGQLQHQYAQCHYQPRSWWRAVAKPSRLTISPSVPTADLVLPPLAHKTKFAHLIAAATSLPVANPTATKSKARARTMPAAYVAQCSGAADTQANGAASSYSRRCDTCGKVFARRSNLLKHKRSIHSTIRKHICDDCGFAFKRYDHLTKHVKTTHLKQRAFSCAICPSTFAEKFNRDKHARLHSTGKTRPYQCPCGAFFKYREVMEGCLRCKAQEEESGTRDGECAVANRT